MEKYYEGLGKGSMGEATAKETRMGYYSATHKEPEMDFDMYMKGRDAEKTAEGFVGRPTGEER